MHTHTHTHIHTHTHTHTAVAYQGNETEEKVFKKRKVFKEDLMSCQPHRVTSRQSNSGHKQIHISKLFSHKAGGSVIQVWRLYET